MGCSKCNATGRIGIPNRFPFVSVPCRACAKSVKHTKYPTLDDGEHIIIPRGHMFRFRCCDCGLVHDMYHEVQKDQITLEFWRNRMSTGQLRRHHNFPFKATT